MPGETAVCGKARRDEMAKCGLQWIALDRDNLPNPKTGPFLVTNNINARNAHGQMSHVWCASGCYRGDQDRHGVTCFDDAYRRITGLTHYAVIGLPSVSPKGD